MKFTRTGFILYVKKYLECVTFYRDILGLSIMFSTQELTCFAFGDSYLMVEIDDRINSKPTPGNDSQCLRMNVRSVKECSDELIAKGLDVDYQEHSWGTIAKFKDPDGNLCAFKDDEKFEQQIEAART